MLKLQKEDYGGSLVGIVYSVEDLAGKGIADFILGFIKGREIQLTGSVVSWFLDELNALLVGFKEDVIYFDFLDDVLPNVSFYVVLSRHKASSGIKSLTVHHTGNPTTSADMGGRPKELSIANPIFSYLTLRKLSELVVGKLSDFEVVYEVTHHGPTSLQKPLTFVEIGSSEAEWSYVKAHEVVGESVVSALRELRSPVNCTPTVGFGGPHYADGFAKRALKYGECYGHIISRYAIREIRGRDELEYIVRESVTRSKPAPIKAVLSRKIGSEPRSVVVEALRSLGVSYEIIDY
ncbi:MAG: D-aminoacyl-tRNA deacylase [Zestosphaera sp.]